MKNIQLTILLVLMSLVNGISQETPLLEAIADENLAKAQSLIEKKQDIIGVLGYSECPLSAIIEKAEAAETAETYKIKSKHTHKEWVNLAQLLIDNGTNVNYKLRNGVSMIELSLQFKQKDITNLLLDKNVVIPNKPIVLLNAIEGGFDRIVSQYLEKSYSIVGQNDKGLSALHLAAQIGDVSLCNLLLDKRAPINAQVASSSCSYFDGMTALHIAAAFGQSDVVETLIERSAQLNVLTKNKQTPLHLAVGAARWESDCYEVFISGGNLKTVQILLAKGMDINAQDELKLTPYHWAVYYRQLAIADVLIDLGATPMYSKKSADHVFASALSELWYQIKKKDKTTCDLTQAKLYFDKAAKAYQSSLNKMVAWKITEMVLTAAVNVGSAYNAKFEAQRTGFAVYEQYQYPTFSSSDDKEKKKYYKAQKVISEQLTKWCDSAPTALPYNEPTLLSVLTLLNVKKLMSADNE